MLLYLINIVKSEKIKPWISTYSTYFFIFASGGFTFSTYFTLKYGKNNK